MGLSSSTSIKISKETRNELYALKGPEKNYDDIIRELIKKANLDNISRPIMDVTNSKIFPVYLE